MAVEQTSKTNKPPGFPAGDARMSEPLDELIGGKGRGPASHYDRGTQVVAWAYVEPMILSLRAALAQARRERDAAIDEFQEARKTSYLERAEAAEQQVAETRAVLRKLMKEATAVVALAEPELCGTIGHTNIAVFKRRISEAGAALGEQKEQP